MGWTMRQMREESWECWLGEAHVLYQVGTYSATGAIGCPIRGTAYRLATHCDWPALATAEEHEARRAKLVEIAQRLQADAERMAAALVAP